MVLKRYDHIPGDVCGYNCGSTMEEAPDGTYVRFEDIEELLKDLHFLECLRWAGVDNWDGYSYAWELFEEKCPEEELA